MLELKAVNNDAEGAMIKVRGGIIETDFLSMGKILLGIVLKAYLSIRS